MSLQARLRTLEAAGLVRLAATLPEVEYLFRHALIQAAAYTSLVKADRRSLHLTVGETLERFYPQRQEELAPLLAWHFREARDDRRAFKYFVLAGDAAARSYANVEAAAHYAQAIQLASRLEIDADQLQHLYLNRGQALELNAQFDEALTAYAELQTLADQRRDRSLTFAAVMALAKIYSTTSPVHDPQRAQTLLIQALTLTHELDDRASESKVLWNLMVLNVFAVGDMRQAMAYGEQSLAIARELNLQEQLAFTLNDLVYAYNPLLRMPETLSALEESRRLWQELDNRPMLSNNLANSSIINFQLGDYDRAIAYADEAHQLSQSIGNLWGQANSRFQIGHVYFERGQIDQAIAMMAEATQLGEPVGHPFAFISAQSDLGWVYGSLGQIDKGLELAQAALKRADELSPELAKPWVLGNLARLHLLNHDLEAAAEAVQAGAQLMRVESLQLLAPILVPLAEGEFHFAHGDYEQALTTLDNLVDWLHRGQWQPFISDALYIKGQILLAQRQIDQAFSVLSEARAQAEALGSRRTLWPILLSLSEIEAKRNSVEADLLRQQAQAIIDYIAGEIGDPALRTAFSRLAERRMTL